MDRNFSEPFVVVTKHIYNVSGRDCNIPLMRPVTDFDCCVAALESVRMSTVHYIDTETREAGRRVGKESESFVDPGTWWDIVPKYV